MCFQLAYLPVQKKHGIHHPSSIIHHPSSIIHHHHPHHHHPPVFFVAFMFVASPCLLPQCERPDLFQPLPHMRPVVAGKNYERKVTLPFDTTVAHKTFGWSGSLRLREQMRKLELYKFGEVAQVCWDILRVPEALPIWFKFDIQFDAVVHGVGLFACFLSKFFFQRKMPWNARGNVRNAKPNRKMDGATCAWDAWKLRGRSQWQWLRIQSWKSLLRKVEVCEPLKELYMSGMFSRSSFRKRKTTSS